MSILTTGINGLISLLTPSSNNFIFSNLFSSVGNIFSALGNMLSYINPFSENFFGYKIVNDINTGLLGLFTPQNESWNSVIQIVKDKFGFITAIRTAISSLDNIIHNIGVVDGYYIDLGATKYTQAMRIKVIDFSWYQPYKSYVDTIITGFIYILFLWRLFVHLPNIINGTGGDLSKVSDNYRKGR